MGRAHYRLKVAFSCVCRGRARRWRWAGPTFTPGGLGGITDPLIGASCTVPGGSFPRSLIGLLPVDRGTGGGGVVLDSTATTLPGTRSARRGAVYSYRSADGSAITNITCEKHALIPSQSSSHPVRPMSGAGVRVSVCVCEGNGMGGGEERFTGGE